MVEYLGAADYICEAVYTYKDAIEKVEGYDYDCIILDIMLPGGSGLQLLKYLKKIRKSEAVIIISAKNALEDRIEGLQTGADDYLVKPFGITELSARIRAVLRRRKIVEQPILKVGDVIMDGNRHEVTRAGKKLSLTPKEYRLLESLVRNAGQALSRRQLLDEAWGSEFVETNHELNVHMRYLRTKLDPAGTKPLIRTIRGVGYTLREK